MFVSRGTRRKNEEGTRIIPSEPETGIAGKKDGKAGLIEPFFINRIAGWFAFGLIIVAVTFVWCLSTGWQYGKSLMGMGLLLCALGFGRGFQMLYISKSGKWFSLLMTCKDAYYPKVHENIGEFINPTSQTAFKPMQQVTFEMENGTRITFAFDRMRKFLLNSKYDFYFTLPRDGGDVTIDMLQDLKIDHSIHPENLRTDTQNSVDSIQK